MPWYSEFDDILRRNELLRNHVWLQLGGPAEFLAEPRDVDQLRKLVARCHQEGVPLRVLGGGSNLLVREQQIPGVVLRLSGPNFSAISTQDTILRAGSAARLGTVISEAVGKGLAGLESLVGIPGTLGGALHGNAGTRGGDISQWIQGATLLARSGEVIHRKRDEMVFAYRHSSLDELVILEAEFKLERADPEELAKRMQKQWILAKAGQPLPHQAVACVFKHPQGLNAGTLIEQAGLKGTRIGGAEVSERDANFIIAGPEASSADVLQLIDLMRERVAERVGVELETQIEVW